MALPHNSRSDHERCTLSPMVYLLESNRLDSSRSASLMSWWTPSNQPSITSRVGLLTHCQVATFSSTQLPERMLLAPVGMSELVFTSMEGQQQLSTTVLCISRTTRMEGSIA